jgi:thiamine biosynthesis lipoprotein
MGLVNTIKVQAKAQVKVRAKATAVAVARIISKLTMSELIPVSPKLVSRRDFLKITAVAGALLAGGSLLRLGISPKPVTLRESQTLMGTLINLILVTDDAQNGRFAIDATFAEMRRLIAIFDHRQADNTLSQLNQQGRLTSPQPELLSVLSQAIAVGDLTGGAFDVSIKPLLDAVRDEKEVADYQKFVDYRRIQVHDSEIVLQPGMALTLDGIAKGSVVDGAVAALQAQGYENVLVEAGGDLVGNGRSAANTPWHIGIQHPRQAGTIMATLPISAQAVATSGDYMNAFTADFSRHHILDPRTGQSPAQSASVTVLAANAATADALSTSLMVMGSEAGLALVERLTAVEALFITKEMQIYRSSGFPSERE